MTAGQTLLFVLFLFYFSECFLWVDRGTVAFVSSWGGKWRWLSGHWLLGNVRGGLVLLNPFPPFGEVYCSHALPVSISPEGVCARSLQSLPGSGRTFRPGRSFSFEEIGKAGTREGWLTINGERFALCATTEEARDLAVVINASRGERVERREGLIEEYFDRRFDHGKASERLAEVEAKVNLPRWACAFFFLFLYWIVPVLSVRFGLVHVILPGAAGMFVVSWGVTALYFRTHKGLYPSRRGDRIRTTVKMILCPPLAMRAVDPLTSEALGRFDPVVVASLLPGEGPASFVRSYVRDLRYPVQLDGGDGSGRLDDLGAAIAGWHAERLLGRCLAHVKEYTSLGVESLFSAPSREPGCTHYCPRCEGQFLVEWGECPDCPGVALESFEKSR